MSRTRVFHVLEVLSGTQEIIGYVLPDNRSMLTVCDRLGFTRQFDPEEEVCELRLRLQSTRK